jgi:hypothetical protein
MPSISARSLFAITTVGLWLGVPSLARADDDGIKIGEGRLHPYLNLDGKWDSFASVSTSGSALSDFLFDIDPGLKLHIPSHLLSFGLDGDVDEVLYATYTVLDRTLINGDLALDFFNQGVVGLNLTDRFTRQNNATVSVLPFAVLSDLNVAAAELPIRPGGGAMVFTPSYSFTYQHFEGFSVGKLAASACPKDSPYCDPSLANELDYIEQRAGLDAVWKFLPKTAALLNAEFLNIAYLNGANNTGNAPLNLFDVTLGLSGLITTHFEVVARAGYAQTFLTAADVKSDGELAKAGEAHDVIGQLELGYLFSETGSIRLGFTRVLQPVPTALAYYEDNRPYFQVRLLFGRLTLHLDASLDIDTFASNIEETGNRTDLLLHVDVGPEVEIFRWFRAAVGYDLTSLGSDDSGAFTDYTGVTPLVGSGGYTNNEFYLRLTFVY